MEFKYLLILIALCLSSTVMGKCGLNAPKSPLCLDTTTVGKVSGDCESQVINLEPKKPCCALRSLAEDPNGCPPSDGSSACRSVELDKPICAGTGASRCRAMSLSFELEVQKQEGTCCETCSCWGDPHCEAFSGKNDTWILCDSRSKKGGATGECGITKSVCLGEKDHNGNDCKWIDSKRWNVGLKGSQCVFDMKNQALPFITMYTFNGFSAIVDLGERGVILQLKLVSGKNKYFLDASNCFSGYALNINPWRAEEGAVAPPADESWAPYGWPNSKGPAGDITWSAITLDSGVVVHVKCTRTAVVQGGKVRFGPARLNIEGIVEPKQNRPNRGGFCVTDKIDKQQSTVEHTNKIELDRTCADASDELAISKLLCSKGISRQSISTCMKQWCTSVRGAEEAKCRNDIKQYKWKRTFCAIHTTISKQAKDCTDTVCKRCMTDIDDFGWVSAILKWSGKIVDVAGAPCTTAADLPTDLVGCQRGILIQYEVSEGVWKTYKAVPETANICDDKLKFDSQADSVLFNFKVRVSQCSVPPSCMVDQCKPENGFSAKFDIVAEEDVEEDLVKLVESGDLICDPKKYPNDVTGCMKIKPEPMCPCP